MKQEIKEYYTKKGVAIPGAKHSTNRKGQQVREQQKPQEEDYGSEVESDDEDAIEKIKQKHRAPQNTWIIKPGENTNRGQGITVVKTIREVQSIIGRPMKRDADRTFII